MLSQHKEGQMVPNMSFKGSNSYEKSRRTAAAAASQSHSSS